MRIRKITLEENGEEFSIKFLPNLKQDNSVGDNCVEIIKYFINNDEVSRVEYWTERNKPLSEKKAYSIRKFASYALVNGEYCIFPFSKKIKSFILYAIDGGYVKIANKDHPASYYTFDEFEEFKITREYYEMRKRNQLDLIEEIKFENPINLYDIKNDWSLKFKVEVFNGYIDYKDIRIEKDSNNLLWDGEKESQDKVITVLKNKNLVLESTFDNYFTV